MNLSDLPADVIRNIVRIGHESFDSMRLISYRWYELCQKGQKWLPVMNSFSWEIVSSNCTKLITQIPKKSLNFFGINKRWWQYRNDEFLTCYYYVSKSASDPILIERLVRLFNRCSRVKLLYWMCRFQSDNPFDLICNSMHNVIVEKLSIEYERNTSKEAMLKILDIVRNNTIQNVHVGTCDINGFMHSVNILCDIARAGSAILISAQYWERDPVKLPLRRASWEEFYQLINNEEGIRANLQEYSTGESQFSISIVANIQ